MQALKSGGMVLLGVAFVVGVFVAVAVLLSGAVWLSEKIVDYLILGVWLAFAVCIFILMPLSLFRKTRSMAAFGFMACSTVFGVCTLILGLLTAYFYWGFTGIIIGLFIAGVGVVPVGILAAIFHSDWQSVLILIIGVVVTFGGRGMALWLAQMVDRAEQDRRLDIIEGETVR